MTVVTQVCRLAYELMQNYHIDASNKYYSLDDVYYFGGQQAHDVVAIEKNMPLVQSKGDQSEIPFQVGDDLGIAGNDKNGYSVGINRRTNYRGRFPSYKVEEHVRIVDFPNYKNIS